MNLQIKQLNVFTGIISFTEYLFLLSILTSKSKVFVNSEKLKLMSYIFKQNFNIF